jgi:hypothetical protein
MRDWLDKLVHPLCGPPLDHEIGVSPRHTHGLDEPAVEK